MEETNRLEQAKRTVEDKRELEPSSRTIKSVLQEPTSRKVEDKPIRPSISGVHQVEEKVQKVEATARSEELERYKRELELTSRKVENKRELAILAKG